MMTQTSSKAKKIVYVLVPYIKIQQNASLTLEFVRQIAHGRGKPSGNIADVLALNSEAISSMQDDLPSFDSKDQALRCASENNELLAQSSAPAEGKIECMMILEYEINLATTNANPQYFSKKELRKTQIRSVDLYVLNQDNNCSDNYQLLAHRQIKDIWKYLSEDNNNQQDVSTSAAKVVKLDSNKSKSTKKPQNLSDDNTPPTSITYQFEQQGLVDVQCQLSKVPGLGRGIKIGVTPRQAQSTVGRKLVFLLDRSSSMRGEPILNAKQALKGLLERLKVNDTFTLILFNQTAEVKFLNIALSTYKANQAHYNRQIDSIQAIPGTHFTNAFNAIDSSMLPEAEQANSTIVFLTDGQDFSGLNPTPRDLIHILQRKVKFIPSIICIGFANHYNQNFIMNLGELSGINFHLHIRDAKSIDSEFRKLEQFIQSARSKDPVILQLETGDRNLRESVGKLASDETYNQYFILQDKTNSLTITINLDDDRVARFEVAIPDRLPTNPGFVGEYIPHLLNRFNKNMADEQGNATMLKTLENLRAYCISTNNDEQLDVVSQMICIFRNGADSSEAREARSCMTLCSVGPSAGTHLATDQREKLQLDFPAVFNTQGSIKLGTPSQPEEFVALNRQIDFNQQDKLALQYLKDDNKHVIVTFDRRGNTPQSGELKRFVNMALSQVSPEASNLQDFLSALALNIVDRVFAHLRSGAQYRSPEIALYDMLRLQNPLFDMPGMQKSSDCTEKHNTKKELYYFKKNDTRILSYPANEIHRKEECGGRDLVFLYACYLSILSDNEDCAQYGLTNAKLKMYQGVTDEGKIHPFVILHTFVPNNVYLIDASRALEARYELDPSSEKLVYNLNNAEDRAAIQRTEGAAAYQIAFRDYPNLTGDLVIPPKAITDSELSSAQGLLDENELAAFMCPISLEFMKQAWVTPCGHRFEEEEIKPWVEEHNNCPCCRESVNLPELKVDHVWPSLLRLKISIAESVPLEKTSSSNALLSFLRGRGRFSQTDIHAAQDRISETLAENSQEYDLDEAATASFRGAGNKPAATASVTSRLRR